MEAGPVPVEAAAAAAATMALEVAVGEEAVGARPAEAPGRVSQRESQGTHSVRDGTKQNSKTDWPGGIGQAGGRAEWGMERGDGGRETLILARLDPLSRLKHLELVYQDF